MALDIRRLQVLRQVALRGTIVAAAEALAFTPSAVSQQLTALERETGAQLLERSGRSVRLTDAARVLVEHAEAILIEVDRAETALAESMTSVSGKLRVGAFASVTASVLGPAVAALGGEYPALTISIRELDPSAALRELRLGEVDVVFAHDYDHMRLRSEPGIERRLLFTEPMFVVAPIGRFGPGTTVKLEELEADPFAAAPAGSDCGVAVREACRAVGFDPDVRFSFGEFGVLLDLVRAGLAVSLLPALALSGEREGYEVHSLATGTFGRRVFVACRQSSLRRPAVTALLNAATDAAASMLPIVLPGS